MNITKEARINREVRILNLDIRQQLNVLEALGFTVEEDYVEFVRVDGEYINYDSLGDKILSVLGVDKEPALNIEKMVSDIDIATKSELVAARDWVRAQSNDVSLHSEVRSVCSMFYKLLDNQIAKF